MTIITFALWSIIVFFTGAILGFSSQEAALTKDINILGSFRLNKVRYIAIRAPLTLEDSKEFIDEVNQQLNTNLDKEQYATDKNPDRDPH